MFKAVGCPKCRGTGYMGRTVVAEVLEITPELADRFSKDESLGKITKYLRKENFIEMKDIAYLKVLKGITDLKELKRVIG